MITFKQFFLKEAKYLPGPPTVYQHSQLYAIKYINGAYHVEVTREIEQNPNNIIGYIFKNPDPHLYKEDIGNNRSIKAALGVYEADERDNRNRPKTQSKIYAFHLAKNKLEAPGARQDSADDTLFYNQTIAETVKLAKTVIESFGNNPVTVISPRSTMEFNQTVINELNVENIVVNKMTFVEAANGPWRDEPNINKNVLVLRGNNIDEKWVKCKIAILFLKSLIENNDTLLENINIKPGQQLNAVNDTVSRERLAYIIWQIMTNEDLRTAFLGFARQYEQQYARQYAKQYAQQAHKELGLIKKIIDELNNENQNRDRKGYFIQYLASAYFKNLNEDLKLRSNILVIDDNIDSSSTYKAVNDIIRKKADEQRITPTIKWVVGIIPVRRQNQQIAPAVRQGAAPINTDQQKLLKDIESLYKEPVGTTLRLDREISSFNIQTAIKKVEKNLTYHVTSTFRLEIKNTGTGHVLTKVRRSN